MTEEPELKPVVVILGPTASGKTRLSVKLAQEIGGEIISADSMQIYKYMNIGTAKPDEEERGGIRHYLIDEVTPDCEFSVARFRELALGYIREILGKGRIPIITGGTGLYINSLIYNISFSETISDWCFREELQKEAREKGNKYMHDRLAAVDPEAAGRIHVNDTRRIIRALEVFKYTNVPISTHMKQSRNTPPEFWYLLIGLTMDRQRLYERIDRRVDLMLEKGLTEEVAGLVKLGYDRNSTAMQGLGYKEILSYRRGELTYKEMAAFLKRSTRRYAKRQMTWFRKIEDIHWINLDEYSSDAEVIKNMKDYIASYGIF